MKTQGEIEAAISKAMGRFEQDHMGRGPRNVHTFLNGDFLVVRLQDVLTVAEEQLVRTRALDKGRDLVKQVRTQLIEIARPLLETLIHEITGVKLLSLHHDISTSTGEEVVIFTMASTVPVRDKKAR